MGLNNGYRPVSPPVEEFSSRAKKETEKVLPKYKELFDLAPVGGIAIGRDGVIRIANLAGAEILGCKPSGLVGLRLDQLIPDAARPVFTEFIGKMTEGGQKARCEMELAPGGVRAAVRFEGVSNTAGDVFHIAMIDIADRRLSEGWAHGEMSESNQRVLELSGELARANRDRFQETFRHKMLEEKLKESLQQQRKLAAHFIDIREQERTTIAREVHDELGQMLASLQLNVSLLSLEYGDHEQLVVRTKAMEQLINSSIATVQRISSELRPVMLDLLGLADAMDWQAREFRKKSGISCKTTILLAEKKVDRGVSTAVFRIFQEALTNVIRHSGATCVQAYLVEKKEWLTLSVRDNGRGITENEKKNLQSFGIAGMRERAEAFGGKLKICGSPINGTALFARIPVRREGEPACHAKYL